MRLVTIGIAVLALAAGPLTAPPDAHATTFTCNSFGKDVRWADRHDPTDARLAITTQNGKVTLILTERDVMFQLSDRAMRQVRRELKDARDDNEDNVLASAVVTVVTNTVAEVLDHSLQCHVRDLRDVSYEDGRLVFIGKRGKAIFCGEESCDPDCMQSFSERDAQAFVREFRKVKAGR